MPATFILTTKDPSLEEDWRRQLPEAPLVITDGSVLLRELQRPGARVWIRDICDENASHVPHPDTVTILVGEPQSIPFEESKGRRENTYFLSYDESRDQLRRIAAMAAELAQKRAVLAVLQERPRRVDQTAAEVA